MTRNSTKTVSAGEPYPSPVPHIAAARQGRKSKSKAARENTRISVGGQVAQVWRNPPPVIRSLPAPRTELLVTKTEAMNTLVTTGASGAFALQTFDFHPGSSELNWLRNMSNSFAEWQLIGLEYTYVPSVPTTQIGSVTMALQADYFESNATTMAEIQRYDNSVTGPVYAGTDGGLWINQWGINHPNTVGLVMPRYMYQFGNALRTWRITSQTTFAGLIGADKNDYSPGRLIVGTSGTGLSSTPVGTMFVRYCVRLLGSVPISLQQ